MGTNRFAIRSVTPNDVSLWFSGTGDNALLSINDELIATVWAWPGWYSGSIWLLFNPSLPPNTLYDVVYYALSWSLMSLLRQDIRGAVNIRCGFWGRRAHVIVKNDPF